MSVNTYSRKDFKVGQVLYGLTSGTIKRVRQAVNENCDMSWDDLIVGITIAMALVTVTKVGTVYLTVVQEGHYHGERFTIENLDAGYERYETVRDNTIIRLFETKNDALYSLRKTLLVEKIKRKIYKYSVQFKQGLEVANSSTLVLYLDVIEDIIKQGKEYLNNH